MHEIGAIAGIQSTEKQAVWPKIQRIPADVRDFMRCAVNAGVGNAGDAAGNQSEAGVLAKLLPDIQQDLHADAEYRRALTATLTERALRAAAGGSR